MFGLCFFKCLCINVTRFKLHFFLKSALFKQEVYFDSYIINISLFLDFLSLCLSAHESLQEDEVKVCWKWMFSLVLSDTQEAERDGGPNRGSQIAVCVCVCVVWVLTEPFHCEPATLQAAAAKPD